MMVDFDFSSLAICSRQPQQRYSRIYLISLRTQPLNPPPRFLPWKVPMKTPVALRQRAHMFHLLSWRFARIAQVCLAPVATDQLFVQGGVLGLLGCNGGKLSPLVGKVSTVGPGGFTPLGNWFSSWTEWSFFLPMLMTIHKGINLEHPEILGISELWNLLL